MSSFESGDSFAEYTIERLIGSGGMGTVYLAQHPRLPRRDALKILAGQFADDEQFRARFEREAHLVAGISHPGIVKVHDRGEVDGRLWIAFEFVNGRDLSQLIAAGLLPVPEIARIVAEVADALDAAGAEGLVHRDVKPANILLDRAGRAMLTDFGIARTLDETGQLTGTGLTMGTVNYASPEQLLGQDVGPRSDQYSLACTAYALLSGEAPYAGPSIGATIIAHARDPIPSLLERRADLPEAVDAVFDRALAKDPADRFQDSRSFAAALAEALGEQESSTATLTGIPYPLPAALTEITVPGDTESVTAPTELTAAATAPTGPVDSRPARPRPITGDRPAQPATPARRRSRRQRLLTGSLVAASVLALTGAVLAVNLRDSQKRLEPQPVSMALVSLDAAPTAAKWTWHAPDSEDGYATSVGAVGGTEEYALMVALRPTGTSSIDIVDADDGTTLRTVELPDDVDGVDHCLTFASQRTVACRLAKGTQPHQAALIDLESGDLKQVHGIADTLSVSGETVLVGSKRGTVFAYTEGARYLWNSLDGERLPGLIGEAPVLSELTDDSFSLRSAQTGALLYRVDRTEQQDPAAVAWQPFLGGFLVQETDGIRVFDETGRQTSTIPHGWTPLAVADPNAGGAATVASLPVLVHSESAEAAAFDPATGQELWHAKLSNPYAITAVGFGTKIAIVATGGGGSGAGYDWFDCYSGHGGTIPGQFSALPAILGTDGSHVAATDDGKLVVYPVDGQRELWSLSLDESVTSRVVAAGGKVYDGPRRLL